MVEDDVDVPRLATLVDRDVGDLVALKGATNVKVTVTLTVFVAAKLSVMVQTAIPERTPVVIPVVLNVVEADVAEVVVMLVPPLPQVQA